MAKLVLSNLQVRLSKKFKIKIPNQRALIGHQHLHGMNILKIMLLPIIGLNSDNQLAQLIFRVLSSHFQGRRAYFNKHGYFDRPYGLSLHGRPPEKQATFGTRMGRSLWL